MRRSLIILVMFITTLSFAKVNPEDKIMLGINGDYGGNLAGYYKNTADVLEPGFGEAYGAGVKIGYGFSTSSIVYCGLEYEKRETMFYGTDYDNIDLEWKEYYTQEFLDILGSYRILFGPMYADFGGYYGKRIGDMEYESKGDFEGSGKVDKNYTNDDYGLLLGIGAMISIDKSNGIDLGIKTKIGFSKVLDTDNLSYTDSFWGVTVGYAVFF